MNGFEFDNEENLTLEKQLFLIKKIEFSLAEVEKGNALTEEEIDKIVSEW
jgi:predicted transcriptional regulator